MASTKTLLHRFLVTVTFNGFDGTSRTIKFAGKTGGNKTMTVTSIRAGGMDDEEKLAGLDSRDDMTCTKPYDLATDPDNEQWLEANLGCVVSAHVVPLGANKIPIGQGRTKTGVHAGVTGPDVDATSNDSPTLTVTLGLNGDAA
jgi:hypothetical protein